MTNAELKISLEKSLEVLNQELAQIRTGRATPAILDFVKVDAYDSKMSIQEVGSITMPDSRTLVIVPWDKSLIDNIAKAILESDIQINPIVEGDRVRISFPGLTEERRKSFAKVVADKVEECRQRIRRIRQDVMREVDKKFVGKEISEDEKFTNREKFEKIIKNFNKQVEESGDAKIKEMMTV